MITKIKAFKSSDDKLFEHLDELQKYEVATILKCAPLSTEAIPEGLYQNIVENVCAALLSNKDRIVDILTLGPRSKPKARRINGGTRKPRATQPAQQAA